MSEVKLTDKERTVLGAIETFGTRSTDGAPFGPVYGREWFYEPFRETFDALVAAGLVSPTTEYRLTAAGRLALEKEGGE